MKQAFFLLTIFFSLWSTRSKAQSVIHTLYKGEIDGKIPVTVISKQKTIHV
jgi:hypothetical protein